MIVICQRQIRIFATLKLLITREAKVRICQRQITAKNQGRGNVRNFWGIKSKLFRILFEIWQLSTITVPTTTGINKVKVVTVRESRVIKVVDPLGSR